MTSRDPKGAGSSTIGYPSDSLTACYVGYFFRRPYVAYLALSLSIFRRRLKTHFLRNIDETYSAH